MDRHSEGAGIDSLSVVAGKDASDDGQYSVEGNDFSSDFYAESDSEEEMESAWDAH